MSLGRADTELAGEFAKEVFSPEKIKELVDVYKALGELMQEIDSEVWDRVSYKIKKDLLQIRKNITTNINNIIAAIDAESK